MTDNCTPAMQAIEVAGWLLSEHDDRMRREGGRPMSGAKLHKLLYYAQAAHIACIGLPLFAEDLVRWKYGPVCLPVYKALSGTVTDWPVCRNVPTWDTANVLYSVLCLFGDRSTHDLTELVLNELDEMGCEQNSFIDCEKAAEYYADHYMNAADTQYGFTDKEHLVPLKKDDPAFVSTAMMPDSVVR